MALPPWANICAETSALKLSGMATAACDAVGIASAVVKNNE